MKTDYVISNEERLLMRLEHAVKSGQKVTFVFGAGLTCPPTPSTPGVPNASQMIERVRNLFTSPEDLQTLAQVLAASKPESHYQAAMQFVIECRGQSALNQLIRRAVLEARGPPAAPVPISDEDIERDIAGWHLGPATTALGQLICDYRAVFQKPILTSNFDPLIEIGIRRAGRGAVTVSLPNDGSFRNFIVSDDIVQVVHFHGFWRQSDTLHTPDQLTRQRPLLAGNLRKLLQETVLVVMGYGGWRDVFTESLMKAIGEESDSIDVLWCFYPEDRTTIVAQHSALLDTFRGLPGQRVVPYAGINCHRLLPKLAERLAGPKGTSSSIASATAAKGGGSGTQALGAAYVASLPETDAWVGREVELQQLLASRCSVLTLNGMGGFGKSSLAARYLRERASGKDPFLWCWADCREQGNTLQTHVVNMLERITQGEIRAASLREATTQDVLDVFFQQLLGRKALLIFDNIDHYVDLETQQATGTMQALIDRALNLDHLAQFLFTSRPRLAYHFPRFSSMQLVGLSENEVEKLFRLRRAGWSSSNKSQQLDAVMKLTQGSPLHVNLIATQVARQITSLDDLLSRIEKGTAPEAEDRILLEIWGTLKEEQKEVLRCLAELPHAEPEQRVASCLDGVLNYNRFSKAVRVLKSLNLIVVKPIEGHTEALELHPLVKAFIRTRFDPDEQEPIVTRILNFFDRMIGLFRGSVAAGPPSLFDNWIAKIELCIAKKRPKEALDALYEIYVTLELRGYTEEFLRLAAEVFRQYQAPEDPREALRYDDVAAAFLASLGHLARHDDADLWLEKFKTGVAGKSARYIWFCHVSAYAYWIRGDFATAIKCASEGVRLKSESKADTSYDSGQDLALAKRDKGEIKEALALFLKGEPLDSVLSPQHFDTARSGAFYGNIGRCLQMEGRHDDALKCFRKSARLLETERNRYAPCNRAWAAQWLGETLASKDCFDLAYIAHRTAAAKWKNISPVRSRQAEEAALKLVPQLTENTLTAAGDWECEDLYLKWLRQN